MSAKEAEVVYADGESDNEPEYIIEYVEEEGIIVSGAI